MLIGEKLTRGLGCGGYPEIGEKALRETANEVMNEVASANIIFLVTGLDGGTGAGAIIGLAEALRNKFSISGLPHLVVGVVTLPFDVETARCQLLKKA
ncbi:MAG: tubulin-like doman-containing protein [Candidatus Bathyarchaeia archaeon]